MHGDDVRTEHLETLTRRSNVTWLAASKATREDLARGNVVLAGTLQSNRFIRELAPNDLARWYRPREATSFHDESAVARRACRR